VLNARLKQKQPIFARKITQIAEIESLARLFVPILIVSSQNPHFHCMFSSSKDKKPAGASTAAGFPADKDSGQTTVIAKGTLIEGKFQCAENVRLDGVIHGEVRVEKRLVMGDTSFVQGNIHAKEAAIKGKVKGDIFIQDALHLLETAVIEGNISARTMIVEEGARYNGACKIGAGSPEKSGV
jgi:cytoskeletal protein CcmA (bactofilin family)